MRLLHYLLICLCGLSLVPSAWGQHPVYHQFTVEEGLPSQEVYEIHQDHLGYIWIATNQGVCRYNGREMQVFSTHDGLATNSILAMYEDAQQRLWFMSFHGGLTYWKNGQFKPYPHQESLLQQLQQLDGAYIDRMHIDAEGHLWTVPHTKPGIIHLDEEGNPIKKNIETGELLPALFIKVFPNGQTINGYYPTNRADLEPDETKVWIDSTNHLVSIGTYPKSGRGFSSESLLLKNGSLLCTNKNTLIHTQADSLLEEYIFEENIINLFEDQFSNIWVTTEHAVHLFVNGQFNQEPKKYFPNQKVCYVMQDREGGYWFASLSDGVFYMASLSWNTMKPHTAQMPYESVMKLDVSQGRILSGNGFDRLSLYEGIESVVPPLSFQIKKYQHDLVWNNNQFMIGNQAICLDTLQQNGRSIVHAAKCGQLPFTIRRMQIKQPGRMLMGTKNGVRISNSELVQYDSREHDFEKVVTAVLEDQKGYIWAGTLDSLYKLHPDSGLLPIPNWCCSSNVRITDLHQGPESSLIALTQSNGLYVLQGDSCYRISIEDGFPAGICSRALVDRKQQIWIGTNHGLVKISGMQFAPFRYSIKQYTIADGLPSNQINDLAMLSDTLLLGTNRGLVYADTTQIKHSSVAPRITLLSVAIQDHDTAILKHYDLASWQHEIQLDFEALSFRKNATVHYKYRLIGEDAHWVLTNNRSARYTNLQPGSYQFELAARNANGPWSEPEILFTAEIHPHFTQQWWFRILLGFALLSSVAGISYRIIQVQRWRERNKRRRTTAEHKALRAQMNPHFIFNALNSIQYFVAQNQKKEAHQYLSRFSKLIRNVLDLSAQEVVPLWEELENIKSYLELEKMRFSEKFSYELQIDVEAGDIYIPPMLIQPLLENAIWHGLMPMQRPGKLTLHLSTETNALVCTITDNGIGREQAKIIRKNRSKPHDPHGLKNIRERLDLLFEDHHQDYGLSITDLYAQNQAIGTRVVLRLPLST